jgi:hypothetical protein
MSTGDAEVEEQHNGEFAVTMVDPTTFRITLVDDKRILKYDPIKVDPSGNSKIEIHSPRSPTVAFNDWKSLLDALKSKLKTLLYIAVPKRIFPVENPTETTS